MAYLDNTGVGALWNRIKTYIAGLGFYTKPSTGIPATDIASGVIPTVPTNVSAFTNDAGYIAGYTETDPTVPSWAKQSTKPSYTASEVGALPDTTVIPAAQVNSDWNASSGVAQILNKPTIPTVPTALSAFTDDLGSNPTHTHSQYLTSHQDISGKENTSNKVTSLSSSSTDTQYPSAKCVYDLIGDIETILASI